YGVITVSSLDAPVFYAKTVTAAAEAVEAVRGEDSHDPRTRGSQNAAASESEAGPAKRVGVLKGSDSPAQTAAVETLKAEGAEIVEIEVADLAAARIAHLIVHAAESSSNLARFDAVRFGRRSDAEEARSSEELVARSRGEGFGIETKKLILLGT